MLYWEREREREDQLNYEGRESRGEDSLISYLEYYIVLWKVERKIEVIERVIIYTILQYYIDRY